MALLSTNPNLYTPAPRLYSPIRNDTQTPSLYPRFGLKSIEITPIQNLIDQFLDELYFAPISTRRKTRLLKLAS